MSFYGNITNLTRSTFQYERTYPSRTLMDASAANDGVYVGNYVLVDYDIAMSGDWGIEATARLNPTNSSIVEVFDAAGHQIKWQQLRVSAYIYPYARGVLNPNSEVDRGYYKYIIVPGNRTSTNTSGQVVTTVYNYTMGNQGVDHDVIYEVYGHYAKNNDGTINTSNTDQQSWYPLLRKLSEESGTYERNYAIDYQNYKTSRGYDSTVWQKTYAGNPATPRYVMIAELNTIVPTFDVSADAPSMSPVAPHFDTSSTNFYYKLHQQAAWGLRVKSAANIMVNPLQTSNTGTNSGGAAINLNFTPVVAEQLPSDQTVKWKRAFYDKASNTLTDYTYAASSLTDALTIYGNWLVGDSGAASEIPGAIYYNKAGFDSSVSVHSEVADEISITPTGLSGLEYHVHGTRYVKYQGTIDSTTQFNSAVTQVANACYIAHPNDKVITNTSTGAGYDVYGRDKLYKISGTEYKIATAFEKGATYYVKVTDTGDSDEPQVDTQEISIMLPSIGNAVADMWDLIYGNEEINGSIYRNKTISWLNGAVYYRDNGLRLLPQADYGLGYDSAAVSTLAGAINSTHDLMGMIIRPRPTGYTGASDPDIADLAKTYIYYYPSEGKYYRRGTTYEWDTIDYTTYDQAQKDQPPFLVEVDVGTGDGELQPWPTPNINYYTVEPILETSKVVNGVTTIKYDYIRQQDLQVGWMYFTLSRTPSASNKKTFAGGEFKPGVYYDYYSITDGVLETSYSEGDNKISVTVAGFGISKDTAAKAEKKYYSLTRTPIGDNYRFFEWSATDITRKFFKVTQWNIATETDPTGATTNQVRITEDTYYKSPQKYYILSDGQYVHSNSYIADTNVNYYIPVAFTEVTNVNEVQTNTYYYTIDAKKTSGSQIYVEQSSYQTITISNESEFNKRILYTKSGNNYLLATTYNSSTTYYQKLISWVLTDIPQGINPENATQVLLLKPTDTMTTSDNRTVPKYYYYNPVGASGKPEYYAVNSAIANRLTYQIVTLTATASADFYVPFTYYYYVSSGQYAGSWILDRNDQPTVGREYYEENFTTVRVPFTFYNPGDYYQAPENLNQNTIFEDDDTYYKYSPLFVYKDNNTTPHFHKGEKWNMNVSLVAADKLVLRQYKEVPKMIELVGFGRYMNTMNGAISRVDEYISANDSYTRSRKTIQGTINNVNDLIDVFKDIKANELLISNKYGQIYSRGISLTSDNWITFSEDRSSDQNNWKITVQHKNVNDSTQGTLTTYQVNSGSAQTPSFGATFDILNIAKRDVKGHLHSISSTTVKIPAPSLTEQTSWTSAETAQVITDIGLTASTGAFIYYKQNVGTLKLTGFSNSTTPATPILAVTDSINGAFAKLETYLANLDVSNTAGTNKYITSLSQTDGKISYSVTTLLNTNAEITASADGAVSGKGVRDVINALDYTNKAGTGKFISTLSEANGIIAYETTDFISDIANNSSSTTAPNTAAVVNYVTNSIQTLDSTPAVTDTATAAAYVTGITEVDGKLTAVAQSLFIDNIANNTSSIIAPTTAAVVTYVTNVVNGLDSESNVTDSETAAAYVTGIGIENGKLSILSSSTFVDDLSSVTGNGLLVAPTSTAVIDYVSTTISQYIDSSNNWIGSTIDIGHGGTGTNVAPTAYGVIYAASATAYAATAAGTAGQYLKANDNAAPSWETFSASTVGLGNVTNDAQIAKSIFTGANQMLYSTAADTPVVLAPNTSTTKKFLSMTGDGTNGGTPAWDTLTASDIPNISMAIIDTGTDVVQSIALDEVPGSINQEPFTQLNQYNLSTTDSLIEVMRRMYNHIQNLESRLATLETPTTPEQSTPEPGE